jgi:cob(I)alamin adenosyltransferase
MKIYTKTGDQGTTSLFGGKRVSKADHRIETYGTVDELNSWIGVVRDQEASKYFRDVLVIIQEKLFTVGSMLATEPGNTKVKIPLLSEEDVTLLETEIDKMESALEPMKNFILPGGHQSVSFCHVARTVCRRAERHTIALHHSEQLDPLIIKYLNRLSDFLFVLSRKLAANLNAPETPWKPKMP